MRLALTGRHLEITPAVRRVVEGKLARLERLLQDSALSAQIVLSQEKNGLRADVTLHARGEKFLHGMGRGDALQSCLGGAIDKISQQALKVKGKWQERKRRGPQKQGAESLRGDVPGRRSGKRSSAAQVPAEPAERIRMPRILRSSRQRLQQMSVSDAARKLDGSGDLVVFLDSDTSAVSVLYRSAAGELTLVETD